MKYFIDEKGFIQLLNTSDELLNAEDSEDLKNRVVYYRDQI